MNIKEIEERSGLTRANIRYYEQEGLIAPVRRENKYRDYSEEDLETLLRVPGIGPTSARRIVSARRCGGTLRFEDLKKLGVVLKRAQYFITCGGRIPEGLHFSPATLPLQLERLERDTLPSDQAAQLSLFDPVGEAV